MDKELDDTLCTKYPLIFANRYKTAQETRMFWGFECGNGWFDLIENLCDRIQSHIDQSNNRRIISIEKNYDNVPEEVSQVVAEQVKEKFGTLRFYYYGGDDYVSGLVSMAEKMSTSICMTCGNPGKLHTKGWWHVACKEHYRD